MSEYLPPPPPDIRSLPNDFLNTPFGIMLKPTIDSFYGKVANPLPVAASLPPTPAEPKQQPPHTHPAPAASAAQVRHPHFAMSLPNIGYSQLVLFDKCVIAFDSFPVSLFVSIIRGEPSTIYEKLNSFLAVLPVEKKLSSEESQSLSAFAATLIAKNRAAALPANTIPVLGTFASSMGKTKLTWSHRACLGCATC